MKFKVILLLVVAMLLAGCEFLKKAGGIPCRKGQRFHTVEVKRVSLYTTQKNATSFDTSKDEAGFKIELAKPLISDSGKQVREVFVSIHKTQSRLVFPTLHPNSAGYTFVLDRLYSMDNETNFQTDRINVIR